MTTKDKDDGLSTNDVATLLGLSQATVSRIPKERLDHWVTPGGWRRYRREDVERYAVEWLRRGVR